MTTLRERALPSTHSNLPARTLSTAGLTAAALDAAAALRRSRKNPTTCGASTDDLSNASIFEVNAIGPLSDDEKATALGLLDMQRYLLLMYTSCGWFFDDPAGLETRQVLRYAARAVELAEEYLGGSLEPLFLRLLERVRSASEGRPDASELYRKLRAPFTPSAAVLPS